MTIATFSNHYHLQKQAGNINFPSDVIKGILMDETFVFDPDTHYTLADILDHRFAIGSAILEVSETLVFISDAINNSTNSASATFENLLFTASTDALGPISGVCLVDTSTLDDTVIGFIDLETIITVTVGTSLEVRNLVFTDRQGV